MRKYEMVVVFHPSLNKDGLDAEISKVKAILESKHATDLTIKSWGKREIAYPVKKQKYGIYTVFYFATEEHDTPATAAAQFRINDQILKFQTHVINEHHRRFHGDPNRVADASAFDDLLDMDDMDDSIA